MTVTCYTDASFRADKNVAACGFCILSPKGTPRVQVYLVEGLKTIQDAEIYSVTQALQVAFLMERVTKIKVFTDSLTMITMKKSKNKHRQPEFYETCDIILEHGIELDICHVKAHSGDRHNTIVDQKCREILRKHINAGRD